ncbi:MAG: hypothetical protein OEL56_00440 [Nitrosopumilus sp.]|nr:hypothetical protein [Nitrosopumilus sp.]MDH3515422.1 hypothetical protein [Nitrosopumilus sp.]MDH3564277.1 hypothetical protein [Nitrosopumilus sp.]MDH5416624.1 hypothetical protein [Nitrosopumilus sp.]MDH5555109.1 hypothetical protein [Nitrosopumilus sp.]
MGSITANNHQYPVKKEKTRSVTYRLPVKLVKEIEAEAMNHNISHNVMARQILEKYIEWDRFASKIGMIPVPKKILDMLGMEMTASEINDIINVIKPVIKDTVLFIKGGYDLQKCIEILEEYMKASGMKSDHRIEGELHHFIIQHELGSNWSIFTEQLLQEIFKEFLPESKMKCQTTKSTVIATIALGGNFSEHVY